MAEREAAKLRWKVSKKSQFSWLVIIPVIIMSVEMLVLATPHA